MLRNPYSHLTLEECDCIAQTLERIKAKPESFQARLDKLMLSGMKNELARLECFEALGDIHRIETAHEVSIQFVYNRNVIGEPV